MKRLLKNSSLFAFLAITGTCLASCGAKRHDVEFWSSFGANYTSCLEGIVEEVKQATGYDIHHSTKGSYDGIKTAVSSSLSTRDYPNLMTGYPDHFASYLQNNILVQLNDYIDAYDAAHPDQKPLLEDYYEDYMEENYALDIYRKDGAVWKDAAGNTKPAISALPFNKSTELMGYNGTFVDYCATKYPELAEVPTTWQEWTEKGPKYREIFDTLIKHTDDDDASIVLQPGHKLYFDQTVEGVASNFSIDVKLNDNQRMLDFTEVDSKETRIISWDSTDNMFITLVRQWGSQYTELPDTEKTKIPNRRVGHIKFMSEENKDKTIECLHFFNKMNHDRIFGVPAQFGDSYTSKAFAANKCMFMLCSSGGLSYNTESKDQRFRVAPLPYYCEKVGDELVTRKFVISQGANIALSNYGKPEHVQQSFDTMVMLTRGDLQAKWCLHTGYYPCSRSATESEAYQAFLNDTSYDDPTDVAYREGSLVNQQHYMNQDEAWVKFVDPAFTSSSKIRTAVKVIFEKVFSQVKLNDDYSIIPEGAGKNDSKNTYEKILKAVCDEFSSDKKVVID